MRPCKPRSRVIAGVARPRMNNFPTETLNSKTNQFYLKKNGHCILTKHHRHLFHTLATFTNKTRYLTRDGTPIASMAYISIILIYTRPQNINWQDWKYEFLPSFCNVRGFHLVESNNRRDNAMQWPDYFCCGRRRKHRIEIPNSKYIFIKLAFFLMNRENFYRINFLNKIKKSMQDIKLTETEG